jgi:hypothetical protein
MSIRYLAQEVYRLTRRVEELELALKRLSEAGAVTERTRLEADLLQTRHDLEKTRATLEAKKEQVLI